MNTLCTAEVERPLNGAFGAERVTETCGRRAVVRLDSPDAARCISCLEANPRDLESVDETADVSDEALGRQRLLALHLYGLARLAEAGARSKPEDLPRHISDVLRLSDSLRTVAKDLLPEELKRHA